MELWTPGPRCILQMKVTQPDNTPIEPSKLAAMQITIKIRYKDGVDVSSEKVVTPRADGTVVIERDVPSDADVVSIQVTNGQITRRQMGMWYVVIDQGPWRFW